MNSMLAQVMLCSVLTSSCSVEVLISIFRGNFLLLSYKIFSLL